MKNKDPEFTSIILVALSHGLHFLVIIGIVREISGISLLYEFSSKYYSLILFAPWLFFVYRYYTRPKERVERILKNFAEKSSNEKNLWVTIAVVTILIPFIAFPILFRKPH
jgi:hypothetical protein